MFGIPTFDLLTDAGKQQFIEYVVNLTRKEIISYTPNYSASVQANVDLTPYTLLTDFNAHTSDTTSVHGITDTANLVYTSDSRLTDARTPTGPAGGVLGGTYPNPSFAVDMATQAELDTHTGATTSVHGISNTANLVYTSDSRLTDARTPTAHAATHVPGGSDVLDYSKIIGYGTALPTFNAITHPVGVLWAVNTVGEPYALYRSDGTAFKKVGGGGSITVSDTAPTASAGSLWYNSTNGKTYIYYADGTSNQWVEIGEAAQLAVPGHASTHIRGGSDIIDGDRLSIDYVPTNYTRNAGASGAGDVTDLTAHLAGIDMILPAGVMMPYAGTTEPSGWIFCYGQTVDSVANTVYARLFTAIGTTYGGTGASSFIIPDLRGRIPAGKDNMGGTTASRLTSGGSGITGTTLGANGGTETHTLTSAQMPSHTHTQDSHSHQVRVNSFAGDLPVTLNNAGDGSYYSVSDSVSDGNNASRIMYAAGVTATNQNTGGGGAHQNMPPTIVTNYIIKL